MNQIGKVVIKYYAHCDAIRKTIYVVYLILRHIHASASVAMCIMLYIYYVSILAMHSVRTFIKMLRVTISEERFYTF